MEEKKYKVYKHTVPDGRVYIGVTCQKNPKRRFDRGRGYKDNIHFFRFILKNGWDCIVSEILYDNLSKEEAETKEIELIAFYDSTNPKRGFNIEKGGNLNKEITEETRLRQSMAHLGVPIPADACNNMRKAQKESWASGTRKKRTDYTKDNTGIAERNKERCIRPIYKIDKDSGEILHKYNSLTEAEQDGYNHGCVSAVANGVKRSYKGFIWIKEEDYSEELLQARLSYANEKIQRLKINQYDMNMNLICSFNSIRDVENKTGYTNRLSITSCCKRMIGTAFGFVWRYDNESPESIEQDRLHYQEVQANNNIFKYEQYSIDNVLLHQYCSLKEIKQAGYNSYFVTLCCKGQKEVYANCIWKYAE